jgi:multiple sugar transport system permease protein
MRASRSWKVVGLIILAVYLFWTIAPFYWMIITSLKSNQEIYTIPPTFFPNKVVLDHYRDIFVRFQFLLHLRNSLIVSVSTTSIAFIIGTLGAYAITRLQFSGRSVVGVALTLGYLVPSSILFIPLFTQLNSLKLTNTLTGLILADLTLTVPFCTWLLIGYFRTIPIELEEAALVDGSTRLGALLRIIIPLSAPAIAVTALFAFTLSWNEFLYAVVISQSPNVMPLTATLSSMQAQDIFFWGLMMAMSTLMAIPPTVLYWLSQRWIIGGLVIGGVKG